MPSKKRTRTKKAESVEDVLSNLMRKTKISPKKRVARSKSPVVARKTSARASKEKANTGFTLQEAKRRALKHTKEVNKKNRDDADELADMFGSAKMMRIRKSKRSSRKSKKHSKRHSKRRSSRKSKKHSKRHSKRRSSRKSKKLD